MDKKALNPHQAAKFAVSDFDFGKTGIAICFDIRYPLQFRDMMKLGVKMIVLPTAWIVPKDQLEDPAFRQDCVDIWRAMARTRAYDNEVYFVDLQSNWCDFTGYGRLGVTPW